MCVCVCRRCTGTPRWAASATACPVLAASERVGTSCPASARPGTGCATATTPPRRSCSTDRAPDWSSATAPSTVPPATTSSSLRRPAASVMPIRRSDRRERAAAGATASRRARTAATWCAAGAGTRPRGNWWPSDVGASSTGAAASSANSARGRSRWTLASSADIIVSRAVFLLKPQPARALALFSSGPSRRGGEERKFSPGSRDVWGPRRR